MEDKLLNNKKNIWSYTKGDLPTWLIFILFSLFSCVVVYTTAAHAKDPNKEVIHQFFLIAGGFICLFIFSFINFKKFAKFSTILLLIIVCCLVAVLIQGKVHHKELAQMRWLRLIKIDNDKYLFSFQPAEFAKIILIFYTAVVMGRHKHAGTLKSLKAFLQVIIPMVVVVGLIIGPSVAAGASLAVVIILMICFGGIRRKYIALSVVPIILAAGITLMLSFTLPQEKLISPLLKVRNRTEKFFKGDYDDQQRQAFKAIANGGWLWGRGAGQGLEKSTLYAAENDFAFAVICEEFGILICSAIILLYLILFFRGLAISRRPGSTFYSMFTLGFIVLFMLQAMESICSNVGILPVIGQGVPFFMNGMSNYILMSLGFGIILRASRYDANPKQIENKESYQEESGESEEDKEIISEINEENEISTQ
jgi:cell division protein FtsW